MHAAETGQEREQRQPRRRHQGHLGNAAEQFAQHDMPRFQIGREQILQSAAPLLIGDGAGDERRHGQGHE